MPLVLTVVCCR